MTEKSGWNWWAFLFGVLWYWYKGMFGKGLTIWFVGSILVIMGFSLIGLSAIIIVPFVTAVYCGYHGNEDYYIHWKQRRGLRNHEVIRAKAPTTKETKKLTLGWALSWIFGILFVLAAFGAWGSINAVIFFLIAFILLPPMNKYVKDEFDLELSRGLKIAVIVVLLLIASGTAHTSPATGTLSSISRSANPTSVPAKTASPTIYKFGDKVVMGNFAYTFLAKTTESIICGTFGGCKEALGTFMIFDLEIENLGTEPAYLWSPPIKIIDDLGRKYERDSGAEIQLAMSGVDVKVLASTDKLQPNLPKRVKIVFDVPKDIPQDRKGLIEISEESLLTSEKKYVSWSEG